MVTEQELQQIEQQKVPRRSFGSRIGAKQQQEIIQNKQKAQEILTQVNNQQQSQAPTREQLKQSALNYLLAKGKANEAFRALSPKEREEVQNQANDLERTRARIQAVRGVTSIESQASQSLTPQVKEQLIQELLKSGSVTFTQNQDQRNYSAPPNYSSPVKSTQPTPQINIGNPVLVKRAVEIYQSPTGQRIRAQLFPEPQPTQYAINLLGEEKAKSVARRIYVVGTTGALSIVGVESVPTTIKIPLRNTAEPVYFEVQQPVIKNGQMKTFASYQIFAEKTPPSVILSSKTEGGLLGTSPSFTVKLPKYEITSTVFPVTEKSQVITLTTKNGKTFMLDTLFGSSNKIDVKHIENLSNIDRFLLKRLAENQLGKPFEEVFFTGNQGFIGNSNNINTINNVDDIVNNILKDQDLSLGTIIKKNPSPIAQARGKSTTRFSTVAKTKEILSTDQFDIYESKILFKDITNVLAKAEGKTPSMHGYTKVFQEPIILDTEPVNFISFKGSKKTPFSKTFGQVEEQVKVELIETPKPVPKITKEVKAKVISSETSSRINGKLGILFGSFSRYAFTSDNSFYSDFTRGFESNNIFGASAQKSSSNQGLIPLNYPREVSKPRLSIFTINLPREINKNASKEIPREVTKEVTKEIQKELQKQSFKLITKQISKNIPKETAKPFFNRRNRFKNLEESSTSNKDKSKFIGGLTKGFKTYYYSKGNKIYLGGISGKAEAIFKGEKKVLNDLSARFGIEETNKLVKGNNVNASPRYNKYFREFKIVKGKNIKTPNVFIQKRGKRLSTSIERSLIQKARKKR